MATDTERKILIDTNIVSLMTAPAPKRNVMVDTWVEQNYEYLKLSSFTLYELFRGMDRKKQTDPSWFELKRQDIVYICEQLTVLTPYHEREDPLGLEYAEIWAKLINLYFQNLSQIGSRRKKPRKQDRPETLSDVLDVSHAALALYYQVDLASLDLAVYLTFEPLFHHQGLQLINPSKRTN